MVVPPPFPSRARGSVRLGCARREARFRLDPKRLSGRRGRCHPGALDPAPIGQADRGVLQAQADGPQQVPTTKAGVPVSWRISPRSRSRPACQDLLHHVSVSAGSHERTCRRTAAGAFPHRVVHCVSEHLLHDRLSPASLWRLR
jgi:hypothetical protein